MKALLPIVVLGLVCVHVALTSSAAAQESPDPRESILPMEDNDFNFAVHGSLTHGLLIGSGKKSSGASIASGPISLMTSPSGNEIQFDISKQIDNGVTLGGIAELQVNNTNTNGTSSAGIDNAYLFVHGDFGEVNVGAQDPVSNTMGVGPVSRPLLDANVYNPQSGDIEIDAFDEWEADISKHANKLTYKSPVLAGVQAGVSYTPDVNLDGSGSGDGGISLKDSAAISAALKYSGDFDVVGVEASVGYEIAKVTSTSGVGRVNHSEFAIGTALTFLDTGSVELAWRNGNKQSEFTDSVWGVGTSYGLGNVNFGARYLRKKVDFPSSADVTASNVTLYTNYQMAEGFGIGALFRSDTTKTDGGTQSTGNTFGLAMKLFF